MDSGDEVALRQAGEGLVRLEADRQSRRRGVPEARAVGLGVSRPEAAEGHSKAPLEPALLRRGEEDPEGREVVLARRQDHTGRNLERLEQPLVGRVHVEQAVQRVARLEVPVDDREVEVPALDQAVVEPLELRVEDVVVHLLDAQPLVLRPRVEAGAQPQHANVAALNETEGGIEVLLDLAPLHLGVVPVVRKRGREAERGIVVGDALVVALESPGVEDEVPAAAQDVGGGQAEIHTHRGGVRREGLVAAGDERADVGLLPEVLPDPSHEQALVVDDRGVARADVEHADFGPSHPARQLDTVVERHLPASQQTDPAAKEGEDLRSGAWDTPRLADPGGGEVEDAGILQEEGPLLGKEDRETRQVDLARVDLRLAEVRVERGRQLQVGRHVVEQIEPRLSAQTVVAGTGAVIPASRDERPDVQAEALLQAAEARDLTRLRDLEELRVEAGARPASLLELPPDAPADVETPDRAVRREVQALEGDGELRAPALVRARRLHRPDGIPVFVRLAVREHEAVDQGAVRVRREVEGVALIAEGVEQQLDVVVGPEGCIAGHLRRENSVRLGVMAHHADVEVVGVAQQGDLRALARRDACSRDALNQVADPGRRFPGWFVQDAVEDDRLRHGRDCGRPGRPARLVLADNGG